MLLAIKFTIIFIGYLNTYASINKLNVQYDLIIVVGIVPVVSVLLLASAVPILTGLRKLIDLNLLL